MMTAADELSKLAALKVRRGSIFLTNRSSRN